MPDEIQIIIKIKLSPEYDQGTLYHLAVRCRGKSQLAGAAQSF
jgi:hypothetical protein